MSHATFRDLEFLIPPPIKGRDYSLTPAQKAAKVARRRASRARQRELEAAADAAVRLVTA